MTAASVLTALAQLAAIGAAGTGLWAARLWLRASRITPEPQWASDGIEPVDPVQSEYGWLTGMILAAAQAAALNARAARWTAAAVVLTAAQSIAGFLASAFA